MSRQGRYWLFFVIVAVGLALSWTQVGRKTQRVFEAEPVVYLIPEVPCRPLQAPCAALSADRALVLGPAPGGLALRQTGLSADAIAAVEAQLLGGDGRLLERRSLPPSAGRWSIDWIPVGAAAIRLRVTANREVTAAEFPLMRDGR